MIATQFELRGVEPAGEVPHPGVQTLPRLSLTSSERRQTGQTLGPAAWISARQSWLDPSPAADGSQARLDRQRRFGLHLNLARAPPTPRSLHDPRTGPTRTESRSPRAHASFPRPSCEPAARGRAGRRRRKRLGTAWAGKAAVLMGPENSHATIRPATSSSATSSRVSLLPLASHAKTTRSRRRWAAVCRPASGPVSRAPVW